MKTKLLALAINSIAILFINLITHAQVVQLGNGSYTTTFPGVDAAGRNGFPSGVPWVSGVAANKPVPTNDWWSDMIKTDHGAQAFNYPLSFRSLKTGLNINYTIPLVSKPNEYREPMSGVEAIVIGTENLNVSHSSVSDHSDWSVTLNWGDQFNSTINIGSPFVYFEKSNSAGSAKIAVNFNAVGVTLEGNKLIIQNNMNNSNYVVFAPSGSTWEGGNGVYTSNLNRKNYWSMVLLPFGVDINEAIASYEPYAFVFPDKTEVNWEYNETNGKVRTTFSVTPNIKEGTYDKILQGLLPHHWDRLASDSSQPTGYEYPSVRGTIKTLASNIFIVENTFSGILPTLPDVGKYTPGFDPSTLASKIDQIKNDGLPEWTDSYNQGQDMNRLVQAARIANQMGAIEARDKLINTVRTRLEDWLSAETGEVAFLFYYNSDWDALIGYPAGHRQDVNLNDHHFHWGYFVHAAAAIEQFNPGWSIQWGEMINLLIRDAASPSRTDSMFPFLRNFSPYAGHSWANGFATEALGNDQESTSESMQFNSALIHWGTITNNKEIRDLGIYLYTTELSTIQEYWFDVEQRSFQPEYAYEMTARLWASGYDNGTWWTNDVAASYGIQLYPIHAGSLYLGHRKDYVDRVWQEMTQNTAVLANTPNPNLWYDTYWKFLSFTNPQMALDLYRSYPQRDIKVGISDVQTYHWLHTMTSLGQVQSQITADYPIAAAFNDGGNITYVAHNYSNSPITVSFSDGYNLSVPANRMATSRDIDVVVTLNSDVTQVPSGGSVNLTAITNTSGVTKIEFYMNETLIGTDTQAPYTINSGMLAVGFPKIYAKAYIGNDFNLSNTIGIQVGAQTAYNGSPTIFPGTIESGLFDVFEAGNGQGISYSDNDTFNQGNFRPNEGVDASITNNEGATVGWIGAGEWLEYTVNVTNPGRYKATIRYASGNSGGGGPFWFEKDGVKISNDITVPFTGSNWNNWQEVITEEINLTHGEQVIRVAMGNGGFNLGRMTFEYIGPSVDPVLTTINITPSSSVLQANQSLQFTAEGLDQYGNPITFTPSWSSTGGNIDANGLFNGTQQGEFTVQVSSENVIGTASVTVTDNTPTLTNIVITPDIATLNLNQPQQFTAQGYDQNGNVMPANISWTSTGGTILATGEYLADVEGSFVVTASEGTVSSSVNVTVNNTQAICTGGPVNGDYTFSIIDGTNPSISFEPGRPGIGNSIVILYYGNTPGGGYPGYIVTPNQPYQINANSGETIYFYYTYSLPEGGEANTASAMHNFTVGSCMTTPQRVLSSIIVSPQNTSLTVGDTQQFIAGGFDQFGDPFPTTPEWLVNEGVINNTGVFTPNTAGTYQISAVDGIISATANITVVEGTGNCALDSAYNDFTTEISNESINPTMTFVPSRTGIGDAVTILYYGTNPTGGYPGYFVTPGKPYQINANSGETIYYYYTYSLPEGGENNTAASLNQFEVGNCSSGRSISKRLESRSERSISIFPNPIKNRVTLSNLFEVKEIRIYDITGRLFMKKTLQPNTSQITLEVDELPKGFYFIKTYQRNMKNVYKVLKN